MTDNFDKLYYGYHGDRVQFGTMTGTKFSYRIPYSSYSSIYQPRNVVIATPEEVNPAPSPAPKQEAKPEEKTSSTTKMSSGIIPIGLAGAVIGGVVAHATKQNVLVGILVGAGAFAGTSILMSKK